MSDLRLLNTKIAHEEKIGHFAKIVIFLLRRRKFPLQQQQQHMRNIGAFVDLEKLTKN